MAKDNSPLILTAIGVAGTVTTAVLTGKAAIKAERILTLEDDARRSWQGTPSEHISKPLPVTFREKVELTWKEFVLPGASLVGTIACIICANKIGTRRAAAMAAAYSLSERAMVEYKDKVVEQFGKAKEQKVRDEILQDRMETDKVGTQEIFATGNGADLCYEKLTGRYFYSSMENIKHAMNRVNYKINRNHEASLNDFYDFIGLDNNGIGDELGWNLDKQMDIMFTTTLADGNRPCLAFDYRVEPIRDYFRHR
jgi:hypothetical protein